MMPVCLPCGTPSSFHGGEEGNGRNNYRSAAATADTQEKEGAWAGE